MTSSIKYPEVETILIIKKTSVLMERVHGKKVKVEYIKTVSPYSGKPYDMVHGHFENGSPICLPIECFEETQEEEN